MYYLYPMRVFHSKGPLNLSKQNVPSSKESRYENITVWEANHSGFNDFPQQLVQAVQNSPAASAALDAWVDFIAADGFVNSNLNNVKINNQGETLGDLLQQVAYDIAYFEGICVHVGYNADGLPTEYHYQPFEQTRLGLIRNGEVENIKTNPYFGIPDDYQDKYTKTFYTFDPRPEVVKDQMAEHAALQRAGKIKYDYPGQMFWFAVERPLARVYPTPFYYSAFDWMEVDYQIQQFHERNISNNFMLSCVMNVIGDPDSPAGEQDTEGNYHSTVGEEFNRRLMEMFSGSKVAGSAFVNWIKNKDEVLDISAFPNNINDNTFIQLQELVTAEIAIATKVPPILISIQKEGKLGESKEILNAVQLMQARARNKQRTLVSQLKKLFANFAPLQGQDLTLSKYNMVDIIPEIALQDLTPQERRRYWKEVFNVKLEAAPTGPLNLSEPKGETYDDYPEAAKENARIALRWADENGWGSCGTRVGKERANQLASGEALSRETISRMAAFERHRQNSNKELGDGCGRLMWLAWGGDEGIEWAQRKLDEIDN